MDVDEFFQQLGEEIPEFEAAGAEIDPPYFLAANVNALRTTRGMTQAELAKAAGVAQPRIAEIERGDANPRLSTLARLASALGTGVSELLQPPPHRRRASPSATEAERSAAPSARRRKVG